jgi:hypothetical protein
MSCDRLPDRVAGPMNEYQSTTLRKLSIEPYQPKLFAEDLTSQKQPGASSAKARNRAG